MSSGYQCSHFVGDVTFVVAEIRPPEFGQSQYAKFLPGAVARQRPPVHLSIQLAKENHKGFSTISRKQKKKERNCNVLFSKWRGDWGFLEPRRPSGRHRLSCAGIWVWVESRMSAVLWPALPWWPTSRQFRARCTACKYNALDFLVSPKQDALLATSAHRPLERPNTFSNSKEPFLRTPTLGVSNGSKIRLSLVHVMNWNNGWASTWHRTTPDSRNGRYWTVGVNVTRAGSLKKRKRKWSEQ